MNPTNISPQKREIPGTGNGDNDGEGTDSLLFDLIGERKWKEVIDYVKKNPTSSRATVRPPSSVHSNYPLHLVCALQPTLEVVNVLLESNETAISTKGNYGYLPLHIACKEGASYEVVSRLMEVYPAATRCRDDTEDTLPLHLASRHGAPEDVLMAILTTHPEGSFIRDASGKTPLEHARALPDGQSRGYAITALETAPILVATARAAAKRLESAMESRIKGMQEAHGEFVRQLEARHDDEKTEFLQLEVKFHNDLAAEKERNCQLAECILELHAREAKLKQEKATVQQRYKETVSEQQALLRHQEQDLRKILEKFSLSTESNDEHEPAKADKVSPSKTDNVAPKRTSSTSSPLNSWSSLVHQVEHLSSRYRMATNDLAKTQEELQSSQNMVHHLNQLLSSKGEEILTLQSTLSNTENDLKNTKLALEQLQTTHQRLQKELETTRDEMSKLKMQNDSQQRRIRDTDRQLQVQEDRIGNIRNLVASLSYNLETWEMEDDAKNYDSNGDAQVDTFPASGSRSGTKERADRSGQKGHPTQNVPKLSRASPHPGGLEVTVLKLGESFDKSGSKTIDTASLTKVDDMEGVDDGDMSTLSVMSSPARGSFGMRTIQPIGS